MMDRVVFYSKYDMSIGWQYNRIAELMRDRAKWPEYNDIEDIIELYQLMLVIDTGIRPASMPDSEWDDYQDATKDVKKIVAKRFSLVNDDTIGAELDTVDISYKEAFWNILISFGGSGRISPEIVEKLLNEGKANILHLLTNKQAVLVYGEVIKSFLQSNICYARELIMEYLEDRTDNCQHFFFPKELTKEDKVGIIKRYIDSPEASTNSLKLLSESQGNEQLPISPRMRLNARAKYKEKVESISKTGISFSYGVGVTFKEQNEPVLLKKDEAGFHLSYDANWIIDNLDYPTLFNNFIYLFEFVDGQNRWQHISKKSMLGMFERVMGSKGKREYVIGSEYGILQMTAQAQLQGYLSLLEENDILFEDMIKWFFESYLLEEFNAKGFIYNASTKNSTSLEKCRNIAIEIDSILKQYRLFCEDGVVDRELFEISTEHMLISKVPSQITGKYAYPIEENISGIMHLLFSDQSLMFHHEGTERYKNAYEVLLYNGVNYNELKPFQRSKVDYLIEAGILWLDEDDNIDYSKKLLYILHDLFKNEFLCVKYLSFFEEEISCLLKKNLIRIDSSFLSIPEQNYYNYIFNNAEFDNSKDLRNKYAHGSQTLSEEIMQSDYLVMVRMMVLIILKLNEEFCLRDSFSSDIS